MLRELADAVTTGAVSAVELVERALDAVERHNQQLNAVIGLRAEEALAEARAVDARVGHGDAVGPLAGIPFLVKDNMDLVGMRTTWGSLLLAESAPARHDSLTPARLRAAGAIPIGKTNVPEYCAQGYTDNRVFGATRNPWAPDWSPGGSSGGSGAAMAAGMVPFATATDGGGSIRIPAAYCGLYGLKPTNGLVARDPLPAWIDYSTDGPLGLSVHDVRLLLAVQAGPWPGDPAALPLRALEPLRRAGASPGAPQLRPSVVFATERFYSWGPLPGSTASLFAAALASLERELGFSVEKLEPGRVFKTGNIDKDWSLTAATEQAHALGRETIEANAHLMTDPFLASMRWGLRVTMDDYIAARRRRFGYVRELDELLGADAVIVTPTMPDAGFLADGRTPGTDDRGGGSSSYNTQAQNVTGHPALSVPAGLSPNGVPFGLQITGPRFNDELVMAVGAAWETAHPGRCVAPGFEEFGPSSLRS